MSQHNILRSIIERTFLNVDNIHGRERESDIKRGLRERRGRETERERERRRK